MSNLDVLMRLRLENGLKAGARDAKRDISGIGNAAKGIAKGRGFDQLGRDIEGASQRAKRLERQLAALKRSRGLSGLAPELDAASGAGTRLARNTARIAGNLEKATGRATALRRELEGVASAAERVQRVSAGLRRIGSRGGRGGSVDTGGVGLLARERGMPAGIGGAGALASRFGAGALGVGGGAYAVGAAAKKAVSTYADVETAAKDLAITAEQSDATVARTIENMRAEAAKYGVSVKDLLGIVKTFVAAGVDYDTAVKAVIPTLKAAKASFGEVGDTAKAGVAGLNNLGIAVKDLPEAFDRMAKAGKEGNVELKDLARILPEVGAGGAAIGLKGLSGLTDIVSALEILGKVTATPSEAANRLENLFVKVKAPETVKNFKKLGEEMGRTIDLEKEMEKGARQGETKLATLLRLTKELTGGNEFKIAELFGDQQANQAITALLRFESEYNAIRGRINAGSKGMIDADFKRATDRLAADFEKLGAAWDRLAGRIGQSMAPAVKAATQEATAFLDRLERGDTILQRLATRYGPSPEAGSKGEKEIGDRAEALDRWAEKNLGFLSGQKWNEAIDRQIGKSGGEAAGLRDQAAFDRMREREEAIRRRPDEIRDQIARRRAVLDNARARAAGEPGIQRTQAEQQVQKSQAEIARLEAELVKAAAAADALAEAIAQLPGKLKSLERLSGFGLDGPQGEAGPVGSGRDAFGFGAHGTKARAVPLPPRRPEGLKAEVKAEPQDLSGVGKQTMDTYEQAIKAGTARAEEVVRAAVARMKADLSFTATPTIAPRISAPAGGGGGASPARATGGGAGGGSSGAAVRSASLRRGGGGNTFSGPIHVHGVKDVASLHRGIQREADRTARASRYDALHDTGSETA